MTDITETRPALYRSLIDDGWQYTPLKGGGAAFRRLVGTQQVSVRMSNRLGCDIWVDQKYHIAAFKPAAPDSTIAAAAIAQREELGL